MQFEVEDDRRPVDGVSFERELKVEVRYRHCQRHHKLRLDCARIFLVRSASDQEYSYPRDRR